MSPYKTALEIQDACNLRAVAREFVKIVDATWKGDGPTNPAIIMMISKIASLARFETTDINELGLAYDECVRLSSENA